MDRLSKLQMLMGVRPGSRLAGGGGATIATTLEALILDQSPHAYWRLGEASGTVAVDSSGNSANATYAGSPTLGVTGLTGADGDTSVTLNGSSQYVNIGRISALETAVVNGTPIDIIINYKTTSQLWSMLFGTVATGNTIVSLGINERSSVETAGWITFRLRDEASANQYLEAQIGAKLYDGNWHQLRLRINSSGGGKHALWFDGARYGAMTATATGTRTLTHDWYLGARNNRGTADKFLAATLDEVVITPAVSTIAMEGIRLKALTDAAAPISSWQSTPALALSNTDIVGGWDSIYWTRPYVNPDAVGGGDEYLWIGSTDHAAGSAGGMYRGYSASPTTLPSSWTTFYPTGGGASSQNETPCYVYASGDEKPHRIYWHPNTSDSGGSQSSRMARYTSQWLGGQDAGEVLPATGGTPTLDHTGYMHVVRFASDDYRAWSFIRAAGGAAGQAEHGYWTSSDGVTWTLDVDTIDTRSMLPSGWQLVLRAFSRIVHNGTTYLFTTEHPDTTATGARDADPGGTVMLCTMTDDTTLVPVMRLWNPGDLLLTDDLRDVRAYQDDSNSALVHLYIHNALTKMYYGRILLP